MINIVIAFDNKDTSLGEYFSNCQISMCGFLNENNHLVKHDPILMSSNKCNHAFIDISIAQINPNPFLFIAYSHGIEDALICNGNSYIKKDINLDRFSNSLFYTNSCLTGKDLGEELIKNGCLAFIGYLEVIPTFPNQEYNEISIKCDNSGIIAFLSDNISISIAFKRMKNYYTNNIDKYIEIDPFFAAQLVKNREALVLHKNKDIVKEDLFC